jgi:outer membrane biosynthesis protein TonB
MTSSPHRLPRRLLSLSLLLLGLATAHAQLLSAEDFFHGGAQHYLSNNVPGALEVVTNGLAQFPEDEKLKKLYELLNQKNQQQQQQQNQDKKDDQSKQDEKKSPEQKKEDQKPNQPKQDQPQKPKPQSGKEDKKPEASAKPGQMTPAQAARLLDSQKGDEEALVFRPVGKPEDKNKPVKDW